MEVTWFVARCSKAGCQPVWDHLCLSFVFRERDRILSEVTTRIHESVRVYGLWLASGAVRFLPQLNHFISERVSDLTNATAHSSGNKIFNCRAENYSSLDSGVPYRVVGGRSKSVDSPCARAGHHYDEQHGSEKFRRSKWQTTLEELIHFHIIYFLFSKNMFHTLWLVFSQYDGTNESLIVCVCLCFCVCASVCVLVLKSNFSNIFLYHFLGFHCVPWTVDGMRRLDCVRCEFVTHEVRSSSGEIFKKFTIAIIIPMFSAFLSVIVSTDILFVIRNQSSYASVFYGTSVSFVSCVYSSARVIVFSFFLSRTAGASLRGLRKYFVCSGWRSTTGVVVTVGV